MRTILILLLAAGGIAVWAQTNVLTQKKPPMQPTEINSDSADFDLNERRAVYRGHVEVIDPKIKLRCDLLVVDLPETGQRLSRVSAEMNVVVDFTDEKGATYHVTATNAVYAYNVMNSVTNETVTFTGNPLVETREGTISCEPLVWDRVKGHFLFGGVYKVKMLLDQNLGGSGTNASPMKLF